VRRELLASQRLPGRLAAVAAAVATLFAVLLAFVRPWYSSWGATRAEQVASLPGDQIVPGAARATRAISIAAPPERVFAWVAQLGQDRAGFYSYDLLENLVGCEMPRIERLDPALQRWSVGQRLWMYPPNKLGGTGYATLLEYEPGRALAFGTHAPADAAGAPPSGSWTMLVEPEGAQRARLLVRGAGNATPGLLGVAFTRTVFEPLHFAMERRMLEGIQELAEGRRRARWHDLLMLALWCATAAVFVASGWLAALGRDWPRRVACLLLAGALFQILTFAQPSPLLGLPLLGAVLLLGWWRRAPRASRVERPLPAVESDPAG
jgi:hypothetical protein